MKVLPYVYKLTNKFTDDFYIGYRYKNVKLNLRAEDDIGKRYFTSSKYVRPQFNDFNIEIIAEFFSKEDAYIYEQKLIAECIKNINCLNKHYQISGIKKFIHDNPHTEQAKNKMRGERGKIKSSPRNSPSWNKGLSKNSDIRMAKMAIARKITGNYHQFGKKYSKERVQKIKEKLSGRKMTDEQIKKMSMAKKDKTWEEIYGVEMANQKRKMVCKGENHPNAKKINTSSGIFTTIAEACKYFKVSDNTIRKRCLSTKERWKDWFYLTLPETSIG